jgi:hypothetical protein
LQNLHRLRLEWQRSLRRRFALRGARMRKVVRRREEFGIEVAE